MKTAGLKIQDRARFLSDLPVPKIFSPDVKCMKFVIFIDSTAQVVIQPASTVSRYSSRVDWDFVQQFAREEISADLNRDKK